MIKIAVDGMGGDFAPEPIIKGTLMALNQFNDLEITIFGDEDIMKPFLVKHDRLKVIDTKHYLDMGVVDPVFEYRNNKEHSLFKAMKYVADNNADAIVTAGPTQAVVAGGQLILRRLKQMRRAAIAPILPSLDGRGKMLLDSGANVDLRPENLEDLAVYASVVMSEVYNRPNPKVALVNIGSEEGKGRELERETFELLKNNKDINFVGNLEPKEVFDTDVDILVTDGFTGNILMKSMEGTAIGLGKILSREIKSKLRNKIGYLFMKPALRNFKKAMDSSEVGGALVVGLNHVLVKAHGNSNEIAFYNAIRQTRSMVEKEVIKTVQTTLEEKSE
ncbi:MAG TPA: phosphate acyltransferase PlsX [Haploplasma sp.]|nr:phosphate acyltransferase PlsX [Haploplasma sp.]